MVYYIKKEINAMSEWRPIQGYEDCYEVSNTGDVRRTNYFNNANKAAFGELKCLKKYLDRDGYHFIRLCKEGKPKNMRIGRLVALTFVKGYKTGLQVNHIDGNKANDCVSNLEWLTAKENVQHLNKHLNPKRKNNAKSKIVLRYDRQNNLIDTYPSAREAARQTGFSQGSISSVCRGERDYYLNQIWKYKIK